jgi:hypothetical protein
MFVVIPTILKIMLAIIFNPLLLKLLETIRIIPDPLLVLLKLTFLILSIPLLIVGLTARLASILTPALAKQFGIFP